MARPVRNTTRDLCIQNNFQDYPSKMVSITSACLKNNYYYNMFVDTVRRMVSKDYDGTCFAYAMNWEAAVRNGLGSRDFFLEEQASMDDNKFALEYGSIFLGAEDGAVFPFELTDKCRVLRDVELAQPNKSTTSYVMALDIATSAAKNADNAVLTVIKLEELENGGYMKQVVNIRSFHGKRLDALATEVRRALVKFPNTQKVVVDCRGLGDAFPQFMNKPWTDPDTGREYPPLVVDTEISRIENAVPLIHPFIASNMLNQQMVSALTIALEQESIELPITSRRIIGGKIADADGEAEGGSRNLTKEEIAIFVEADALQIELGQIVGKLGANGAMLFDSAKANQHKDRGSSLMMAVHYISGMEETRKKKLNHSSIFDVVGVVGYL